VTSSSFPATAASEIRAALAKLATTPLVEAGIRAGLGRPSRRLDPLGNSFHADRARPRVPARQFTPHPRLAVILTFGQSQLANEGAADALFTPNGGVFNFNVFDGRCHVAKDPLLGTTLRRSNLATRLGDDRVLLVPIAHGGTFIAEWAPGGRMHPRIVAALRGLRARGIRVTHALWQLGETDAAHAPDAEAWVGNFGRMLRSLRDLGMDAPVLVARSTLCVSPPHPAIREAQRRVVEPRAGVFAGADTDQLGTEYRFDDCHFCASGLAAAAQLWLAAMRAFPARGIGL
jgi:hypothetical protein